MNLRTALQCAGVLAFLVSSVTYADATEVEPRGVYKRIKAPQPGERPRVTVQITAEEHATQPSAPSTGADLSVPDVIARTEVAQPIPPEAQNKRNPKGSYKAFWDRISPEIGQGGAGRLDAAISALAATSVRSPRLQTLQNIAQQQGKEILRSTVGTNVSPALVLAVISVESAGRVDAISSAGAQGLMQLMPATAARFGVKDSLQPAQNIAGGVKYLNWLMEEFGNDPILVLAGYNAGEGAVRKHSGVPPYTETRDYVPKVLAAFQIAKALCATPPDLISDGCVFQTSN
ncbi:MULTISPECIES: lytic transglycosylase domain-containing protein [unclassified Ruegeria]|uniref:lytic transglycosylase domain-containing protein n=1 Tax=unclassified Ruegeria TaxID=2625375 RepID=UPI0014880488|nr:MULTISPECIES: lytic transglycosylase domain-containing protein [unclassified Ruegeria]NOD35185.1 transglycosylase SLT domain-containing protein [Ruegeria sp. HKCCD7296]NOD46849.1 transglycosylase SLT domain-containing protein [Ruegeria sp. HKCCD5849]NOD51172.1 transglycosylase SLT domain-containing protein [Ruegeria sp. HKCCD5851]NOD67991.1 transglycosylase SLT domain-containing protein [Ruegeria sp. HKCCD7303]NOE42267.1 transglycosylase SLT domain-containing protein [Ruegeria sp. HKCCD7319